MRRLIDGADTLGALALYAVLAVFALLALRLGWDLATAAGWYSPLLLLLLVPLAVGFATLRR
jgi:hypothetical protein